MKRTMPIGYSGLQILVHRHVAGMVIFLLVFGESMKEFMEAAREGTSLEARDRFLADMHFWVGLAVLGLAALRAGLRSKQGRLPRDRAEWSLAGRIATAMHLFFYVLLLVVPATGLLAYYVSSDFAKFTRSESRPSW